jgi:hypothetical protein
MLKKILVSKSADVETLNDLLNDSELDVDNTVFNKDTNSFKLSFEIYCYEKAEKTGSKLMGLISSFQVPVYKSVLKVNNVKSYILEDTEKIGLYDLCKIEYNPACKKISIITGVPLTFEIFVKTLEMEFKIADTPFKWVKKNG